MTEFLGNPTPILWFGQSHHRLDKPIMNINRNVLRGYQHQLISEAIKGGMWWGCGCGAWRCGVMEYIAWGMHEKMSPCTGVRGNANYERIGGDGDPFRTGDPRFLYEHFTTQ